MANEKVLKYETFLNDVLHRDLRETLETRDKFYSQIAEYMQLKNFIGRIKEKEIPVKDMKTKIDLGCDFYVQAVVPDASRICVSVGLGFFVELGLDEALTFIDKKMALLTERADVCSKDAAQIRANMNLVLGGLREMQHLQELPPEQRDIFL